MLFIEFRRLPSSVSCTIGVNGMNPPLQKPGSPLTPHEEESSIWVLIAGIVVATLAGAGLFWLLKRASGT